MNKTKGKHNNQGFASKIAFETALSSFRTNQTFKTKLKILTKPGARSGLTIL